MKPHAKIISAWQNKWRDALDAFAVLALDLENNPGMNATHWYVLCSVTNFSSEDPFVFSMWLEFKYTGREANSEKFRVLALLLFYLILPLNTAQVTGAALRTTEEILAQNPQLHLMRDPPSLAGKQVRYVMIFDFEEEGQPLQSFLRARSLILDQGLAGIAALRGEPAGWGVVHMAIQQVFGSPDEPVVVLDAPVGR